METKKHPSVAVYHRVESLFQEIPPVDAETIPSPVARLLDLAQGKTIPGMETRARKEKTLALIAALEEIRDYVASREQDSTQKRQDLRYHGNMFISVEDGYVHPQDHAKTPMLRIRLVDRYMYLQGRWGMIGEISFATNGDNYTLGWQSYDKNVSSASYPFNGTRKISNLGNKTYEIIRPIINGYRELSALDRTVDGGQRIIPGHNFDFQPIP